MPNNNPAGRNQYSQGHHRSLAADAPSNTENSAASAGSGKSKRGFASMEPGLQREIASKGGQSQGRENNPGNFANDREKARQAGRKGGEAHGAHR